MSRQRTRVVRIAVLTSLVVLVGAWAPAHAQSPTSMHGPGARGDGGMMLQLLLRSANLTPEQDAKVREILTARRAASRPLRSEEHTSELQSPCNLVCRLLLEKKKNYHDSRQ